MRHRFRFLRIKKLVIKKDRALFGISLVFLTLARRVRHHPGFNFLDDFFTRVRQINTIPVTLAHLAAVKPGHTRDRSQNGFWLRENFFPVEVMKPADNLTGQLKVRQLVLSHRNFFSLVNRNIRGLKNGITQKTMSVKIFPLQFTELILVSRIALEPAQGGDHGKKKAQHRVLSHLTLDKNRALIRIKAARKIVHHHFHRLFRNGRFVFIFGGQGVKIRNHEKGIVSLQFLEILQGAYKMTEMEFARRPGTA